MSGQPNIEGVLALQVRETLDGRRACILCAWMEREPDAGVKHAPHCSVDRAWDELAALRTENAALLAALTGVLDGSPTIHGICQRCECPIALGEEHAPTCEWRRAVELRDRIAARGKEGAG